MLMYICPSRNCCNLGKAAGKALPFHEALVARKRNCCAV